MKKSVWTKNIDIPSLNSLEGDKKCDVLIIGGGMAGILCAYFLQKEGVDYILVEGNTVASGITENTTAKITSQHSLIYDNLINSFGKEYAKMYLMANEGALKEYEKLSKDFDCHFKKLPAYTYTIRDTAKIEREVRAVNSLGFKASFKSNLNLPFKTKGAIEFSGQAQFNPLLFIKNILKELNIYENTFIRDITPDGAVADNGKIKAEKIIVATHFPFINKHGGYFIKLYQERSYVSAYENAPMLDGMYVDENKKGLSFRNYENLLFIGGGDHRTGKDSLAWEGLHCVAKKYYPHAILKYEWAAQDCMSLDGVPYIGQYSKNTPNLYVAAGFNKWGMSSSMVAAKILCDEIMGRKNECAPIFFPQRSVLKPQLFINGFESLFNLVNPKTKRCPHLGCALKWNKNEHTWDCPCHGSRFEEDGTLIDNPSTGNATV